MPPIDPGRTNTSARGRSQGRTPKTKKNVRRQQRQVITQARRVTRTQAAHKRETERKKTLARTAPARQLGGGTRGRYEPKTEIRGTSVGLGGRYTPSGKKVAVPAVVGLAKNFNKGLLGILEQAGGGGVKTGSGPSTRLAASVPKPGRLFGRTAKDVYQFPATTVTSAAAMTSAANELRKGNDKPAKEILKGLDEQDPVWNSALALTNALKGDKKAAAKRFDQAAKSIDAHPGLAALEVYGLKGTVGRGVTRGASGTARVASGVERVTPGRAKVVPRKVKQKARTVASTERAPARLPGTNLVVHRKHSRDAFTRLQTKNRDRYKSNQAARRRGDAESARRQGEHERALELETRARELDPEIISGKGIRRAVDEHMDATERIRRRNRAISERDTRKLLRGRKTKRGGPITSLVTQRITKADLPSIKAYRDRIVNEGRMLDPSEAAKIEANGVLVRELNAAIKNVEKGKVDLANLKRIADVYAERSKIGQDEMVRLKMVDPDQAARRAASPFAVSELKAGKEPATLEAFAKAAQKESEAAKGKVKSAKSARTGLVGGQKVQRANEPSAAIKREVSQKAPNRAAAVQEWIKRVENMDPAQLKREIKREDARQRKLAKADQKIKQRKGEAKEARRKASAANKRKRENPIVLPGGKPISTKEMVAAMQREHGEDAKAAYVSQAPGQTKASAYMQPADEAPNANTGAYGGGATKQGTLDASTEALVTQGVRTQGVIDAFKGFQRFLGQMALRGENGKPIKKATYQKAAQLARDKSKGGQEWVPVRMNPLGATKGQLQAMVEGTSDVNMAELLRGADRPLKGDKDGPWTIVPRDAVDQLNKHMDKLNPGNAQRAFQQGTSAFRRTVLSTSPTWYLGNIGEGVFRSGVNLVGPRSYLTGRRALKESKIADEGATPKQARKREEAALVGEARTIGTGEASLTQMRQHHRDLSQYHDGAIRDMARIGKKILDFGPGVLTPRLIVSLWDGFTNLSMNAVNKTVENQFQTAMLGKAIRTSRTDAGKAQIKHRPQILMTKRAKDLSNKAARESAEGLLNENTASALAKEIDRMYGKYSKFSPDTKTAILMYTPFAAWMFNALRFIGKMPEHNPSFTVATAVAERASEDWRKERGLDMQGVFGTPKDGESVPAWLQGSIPSKEGGHYRAPNRYLPFSVGSDLPGAIAGQFLPQIASTINALQGQDWKGKPLLDDDGDPISSEMRFVAAGDAMMRGIVPGYGLYQRSKDKGVGGVVGKDALLGYVPPQESEGGGGGGGGGDDWGTGSGGSDWESGGWDDSEDWETADW